jgi:hypothetical protein
MDKPTGGFGLWAACPDGVEAAWGAQAITEDNYTYTRWLRANRAEARRIEKEQGGVPARWSVSLLHNRQGTHGEESARKAFAAMLNSGPLAAAISKAETMLHAGDISPRKEKLVTLYQDVTVTIKANTNGSHGYLYMIAYPTELKDGAQDKTA